MQSRRLLPVGLLIVGSIAGAPPLWAQEPVQGQVPSAQAEVPRQAEAPPDPAAQAEGEPAAGAGQPAPKPASRLPGIEEIVIQGAESEAAADYEAADSVTAFDASDLAALGAQSVEDLAAYTPSLEIVTAGATTPTFFIRGVGLNDFNANSAGAVSIYQDDVPINAPALQLGTLFDMEAVNVLRGPQGTGLARNASAGAIKLYTRKPSGEFGSYLSSSFGNYSYLDLEGGVEAPLYEELLSSRFAFRLSQRDGFGKNRCAGAPPAQAQFGRPGYCGNFAPGGAVPTIPQGLPDTVNDLGNWAARGTLRFQPTLDMDWLLGAHGSKRDEQTRLGQSIGYAGFTCVGGAPCGVTTPLYPQGAKSEGWLGGADSFGYTPREITQQFTALVNRLQQPCQSLSGAARTTCIRLATNQAKLETSEDLAQDLDSEPYVGDYDLVGPTRNDVWGTYLRGEIALPKGLSLTTVTGYDTYDRSIDTDLDMSPNQAFEIAQEDTAWQVAEGLSLTGQLAELPVRWDVGGFYLMEDLQVAIDNNFGIAQAAAVATRDYEQKIWSAGGYAGLEWDFWENFTLDGGFRYNWERKTIDYALRRSDASDAPVTDFQRHTWHAPTGTVRLTYRFREDTHAYWKYTRGWKGGHYNATSSLREGVTLAEPETIDAFETGLRGAWFEGRLGLDLSLFYYSYDQYQIFTVKNLFDSPPEFVVLNANDTEVYGSELDLVARPFPGTFLNARFGWLESQFLDFVQIQTVQVQTGASSFFVQTEINNTGNRLLNTPRFKFSLTAEQTVPLGRYGSLVARYDGAWTDDVAFDATEARGIPNDQGLIFLPENTIGQEAFWLHNVLVGYRPPFGSIEISGWVRNLTDKVYKTFAFDSGGLNNSTVYFTGTPRTYGMTFTVSF